MAPVPVENFPADGEVGEFSSSLDRNKSCRLQLFDVMRKRGGTNALTLTKVCAREAVFAGADLFQDFMPARVRQGFRDQANLSIR